MVRSKRQVHEVLALKGSPKGRWGTVDKRIDNPPGEGRHVGADLGVSLGGGVGRPFASDRAGLCGIWGTGKNIPGRGAVKLVGVSTWREVRWGCTQEKQRDPPGGLGLGP